MAKSTKRARARYKVLHWGQDSTEQLEADAPALEPGDVLTALGPIAAIEYVTSKGGEAEAIYRHEFPEGDWPILAVTESGDLVIAGGKYRVTRRGIVG